jgi:general secretion pathway protein N
MIALPAPRRDHGLAALAVLFAGVAGWPWLISPNVPDRPAASQAAPAAPTVAALPPLTSFAAIVERPLFAPTRRPDPARTGPAGPAIETRYRLLGLMSAGRDRKALIADGARRFELKEGDALDGWTVTHVEQDRLVLSSPAGQAVLKLSTAAAKPQ